MSDIKAQKQRTFGRWTKSVLREQTLQDVNLNCKVNMDISHSSIHGLSLKHHSSEINMWPNQEKSAHKGAVFWGLVQSRNMTPNCNREVISWSSSKCSYVPATWSNTIMNTCEGRDEHWDEWPNERKAYTYGTHSVLVCWRHVKIYWEKIRETLSKCLGCQPLSVRRKPVPSLSKPLRST